jgi:murein DD-endopeptidase MepM/ murein hydrolase activator NlpD
VEIFTDICTSLTGKMKKHNAFRRLLHKLRIPYRLVIMNDSTFEEKFSLKLSRRNVFVVISLISLFLITITVFLIAFTSLREYIPGYGNVEEREEVYQLSLKTDSLEQELAARDVYFKNFFAVLTTADSAMLLSDYSSYSKGTGKSSNIAENSDATGLYFLKPIEGSIVKSYLPGNEHYAVDISAPKNSIINSIAEGTVLFSDWTLSGGNTIIILHPGKVISVYMHNMSLFVKQGDRVKAGDPIAVIGNSGENTTGPHLHFELWINLQPVNPENYIAF